MQRHGKKCNIKPTSLKKTTTIEQTKDEEKNIVKLKQISSFLNKLTFQPEVLGISCMQSFVMFWLDRPVLYSTKLKHHNTFTIHCTEIHKKNTQLKGEKPKKNTQTFPWQLFEFMVGCLVRNGFGWSHLYTEMACPSLINAVLYKLLTILVTSQVLWSLIMT